MVAHYGELHQIQDKTDTIFFARQVPNSDHEVDVEPISCQGKHLVALCGKHAHAGNIDDEHQFIETKRFWVAGKPLLHKAGDKTNLMYNLIELRKREPSVRAMMDKLHIMQQPSGYVDQVIMKWHLDEQGKQFPFSLAMRDLFTGAYCDSSRLVMAAISQVSAWIWGKMTQRHDSYLPL